VLRMHNGIALTEHGTSLWFETTGDAHALTGLSI
jgi:hypothetical protein